MEPFKSLPMMPAKFQQQMKSYNSLQNYVENNKNQKLPPAILWQALHEYFTVAFPLMQSAHFEFVYAVDAHGERICYHRGVEEYLGYRAAEINLGWLVEVLHPAERRRITKLTARMRDFVKKNYVEPFKFNFSITHRFRKADNTYIKVLRKIYPFLMDEANNLLVYFCLCIDITNHNPSDKITLDVTLSEQSTCDKEQALAYFSDLLSEKPIEFTKRQLEVIKVWSETDSARIAAERLGITVRTLETHLKNARSRLNVRRSLDVVMYTKEHNLI